jgi:hypothetical protein
MSLLPAPCPMPTAGRLPLIAPGSHAAGAMVGSDESGAGTVDTDAVDTNAVLTGAVRTGAAAAGTGRG